MNSECVKRWKNKTYIYLVKWSQFEKPLRIKSQILSKGKNWLRYATLKKETGISKFTSLPD